MDFRRSRKQDRDRTQSMTQANPLAEFNIESIFHPSDFSEDSEIAFAHALKIALVTKAGLSMLHVAASPDADWQDFPGVRNALERWKLIPKGSSDSLIENLGIRVRKVVATGSHPVEACLGFLERHPADLIVLAVRQHDGAMRWMEKSVGEPIARRAGQMTLFIPHGVRGFVSREYGSVSLRTILIPITGKPRPQPAVDATARLINSLQLPAGTITLLHVGAVAEMPSVKLPEHTGWTWSRVTKPGEPAETILQCAADLSADLIVMTTEGPNGFLDALRGSTSERVLRKARCPVLNLPVGSTLG
jgi:nucleotide-binding universal stress UspA family protein